ncbi:amino acid/polyamine transporter I [Phaeosphaeriaceae sp. PMI808]|nr:amino acid/polyamine transporter I [Phaeosphaeriaceae sp. PMI808]
MVDFKDTKSSVDTERQGTPLEGEVKDISFGIHVFEPEAPAAREMSAINIISAGWIITNSWAGIAATFALAIASGGPTTLIYGPMIMFIMVGACAGTLAELASVYPIAGGQYHWTGILAPRAWSRGLSYCCGALNVFSWIATCAGITIVAPQIFLGMMVFWSPEFEPKQWHAFLLYQGANSMILLYNIYLLKRTIWIHDVGFFLSITSFLGVMITSLARTAPNFHPSEAVWGTFINQSGWVDSVAFLAGLVNPNYMYAGIDGAVHLAEDCKNAVVVIPRALMSTIVAGFVTAFAFAAVMLYCTNDIAAVVSTRTGVPIFEIWRQSTRSNIAATIFLVTLIMMALFALNATHQTASRLTWSFTCDNALYGSHLLNQISPRQEVPVAALVFNASIMFLIGWIYLGSTSAFNAFGTGLILQHATYAIPAALLIYRKRSSVWLPESRYFKLPSVLGWVANILTVLFAIFVLVFYSFPVALPVTATNMNYASAVITLLGVIAALNWAAHARKHYQGPRLDVIHD